MKHILTSNFWKKEYTRRKQGTFKEENNEKRKNAENL